MIESFAIPCTTKGYRRLADITYWQEESQPSHHRRKGLANLSRLSSLAAGDREIPSEGLSLHF